MDFLKSLLDKVASAELYAIAIFIGFVVLAISAKVLMFARVRKLATRTKARFDDVMVEALDLPLNILIFAAGASLVRAMVDLSDKLDGIAVLFLKGFVVLAAVTFGTRLIESLIRHYRDFDQIKILTRGVTRGLIKGILIGLGALIFLDMIGVSITPLLASLGIGSLAVALALQDTLGNLFAGIQIVADKPVRVGDFVKLESGEEGYITEVGWRTTRLRMLPNNIVVIPNSKITNSIITNYYLPAQEMAVLVQVGVHYDSDLKHVEKITCEVGREIMKQTNGGIADFDPFIRYHTFGDSSINFTVILRAKEFVDQYLIKHEFIKALHERFNKEGVTIPFPIRTLDIPETTLNALKGV